MYFGSTTGKENFNIPSSNSLNFSQPQQNTDKLESVDQAIKIIAKLSKDENSDSTLLNTRISISDNKNLSITEEKINSFVISEKINTLDKFDEIEDFEADFNPMSLIKRHEKNVSNESNDGEIDDFDDFFNEQDEIDFIEDDFFNENDGSWDLNDGSWDLIDNNEDLNLIENDEILLQDLENGGHNISQNISNFQSEKNSIENLESQKLEQNRQIDKQDSKIEKKINSATKKLDKSFADFNTESFSTIANLLKEKNIHVDLNLLKNKFDFIFLNSSIQTEKEHLKKEHLKLIKQFVKESIAEGLLTSNGQLLTQAEAADLYQSLKKSFIELYVANTNLFANQSQKKDKKQEISHQETLSSRSHQKAELYKYEPIDINNELSGKISTSKKVHFFAVDLQHEAKIESKKEIKKKLIKEKNIGKEFLKRNEFKNMANEQIVRENILKNINLTSQLYRTAFNSAPPSA
ncbi:MAG: hypothetical protein Q8K60_04710 [Parachlamydiaceae bacterium]|nr:hypothetical protein [Parachlamydiaceae bacterium]